MSKFFSAVMRIHDWEYRLMTWYESLKEKNLLESIGDICCFALVLITQKSIGTCSSSFEKNGLLIFVLSVQVTDSSACSSRKLYLFSDLKNPSFYYCAIWCSNTFSSPLSLNNLALLINFSVRMLGKLQCLFLVIFM